MRSIEFHTYLLPSTAGDGTYQPSRRKLTARRFRLVGVTIEPPQKWRPPVCSDTCHGTLVICVAVPPTMS